MDLLLSNIFLLQTSYRMGKKVCYVVLRGRCPGIYNTWPQCSEQVTGFRGALYHGCDSIDAAQRELTSFLLHQDGVQHATAQEDPIRAPTNVINDDNWQWISKLLIVVLLLLIAVFLKFLLLM